MTASTTPGAAVPQTMPLPAAGGPGAPAAGGPGVPDGPGRPGRRGPRGPGARALVWIGGIVAGAAMLQVGYGIADHVVATTSSTDHTYAAAAVVSLVADGDVTVTVGGSSVSVVERARTGFGSAVYSAQEKPDRLEVTHRCTMWWSTGACRADLDVQVPAGTEVVVRTSAGAVTATGVDGALEVSTGDGDVDLVRTGGPVTARTLSGRVTVDGVTGAATVRTGDGDVSVADATGDVTAQSSSGRVTVSGAGGHVDAASGDGDMTISAVTGDLAARTSSGRVTVTDAGGHVDAASGDGDVTITTATGDVTAKTSSGRVTVSGVLGDVEARSGDGDVTVHGTGEPVALDISTGSGRTTVTGPTDPHATRSVVIRSSSGGVSYLDAP